MVIFWPLGLILCSLISAMSGVAGHLVRLTDLWLCACFCEGLIQFLKLSSLSWEADYWGFSTEQSRLDSSLVKLNPTGGVRQILVSSKYVKIQSPSSVLSSK